MNILSLTKCAFIFSLAIFLLSSCMEKDVYQENKNTPLNPTEVFDFSLTKKVKLNVDYGFTNGYYIIFELYEQNPIKEENDSWVKDEALAPIYAASTDEKGRYLEDITIPSDIKEVWLYSDYLGTISPVKLTIADGEFTYDQKKYIAASQAKTKGITVGNHKYPDDWITMPEVDWDDYGTPSNMESSLNVPSSDIMYRIKKTYANASKDYISTQHEDWVKDNATSEIKITRDTEISLVFVGVNSSTSWINAVGYFTYPTGSVPTESTIQKVLVFPNTAPLYNSKEERRGTLQCGNEVKLKYWNKNTQQFEDKFPANITIGLCLEGNGFDLGTKNIVKRNYIGFTTRYSYNSMNADGRQHIVALRDGSGTNQTVVIGFEDNNDYNYCDALFCMSIAEPNAIDTDDNKSPELPPTNPPTNNIATYKGILTFEDQWPSEGDYDMNDVVIKYNSTIYRQMITNKVYKIVDEFIPIHNGGSYICGFGYQLYKLPTNGVTSIKVEGSGEGKTETEQSHSTVILFNNIRSVLGQKITVTTELDNVDLSQVTPPYNPFIFVNDRSKEVHLVNYPPTNKADMELFNTQDDVSNTSAGIYYIARYKEEVQLMPFGINLPNIVEFNIPAEGVKIYNTYPDFIEWVKSDGNTHKDWYKK